MLIPKLNGVQAEKDQLAGVHQILASVLFIPGEQNAQAS